MNVLDHGATGDGLTDDTEAIRRAFEAIRMSPGRLYFPPGVYKVTDRILLDGLSDVTIAGEAGSSIIDATVFSTYGGSAQGSDAHTGDGSTTTFPFTFEGDLTGLASPVQVRVNGMIQPESSYTVDLEGGEVHFLTAPDVDADILVFSAYQRQAIFVRGTHIKDYATVLADIAESATVIELSRADDIDPGDMLYLRSTETFQDDRPPPNDYKKQEWVVVEGVLPGANSVILRYPTYYPYTVTGNHIEVAKVNPVTNVHFEGLTVRLERPHRGIRIQDFTDCSFRDMAIEGGDAGLWLSRGMRGRITRCRAEKCNTPGSGYAMYLSSVQGAVVRDNFGRKNRHTIEAAGASKEIVISGNIIQEDTGAGISTHGGTDRISFRDNNMIACMQGIYARGRSSTITGNSFKNIELLPLQVGEASSGNFLQAGVNLIVTNNLLDRCKRGIQVNHPLINGIVSDNVLHDCLYDAVIQAVIHVRKGGLDATIANNKIFGSYHRGIAVSGQAQAGIARWPAKNFQIVGNHVVEAGAGGTVEGGVGIRLESNVSTVLAVSNIRIANNHLRRCYRGIEFEDRMQFEQITVEGNTFAENTLTDLSLYSASTMVGRCVMRNNVMDRDTVRITEGTYLTDAAGEVPAIILFRSEVKPRVFVSTEGDFRGYVKSFNMGGGMYTSVNIAVMAPVVRGSGIGRWTPAPKNTVVHVLIR